MKVIFRDLQVQSQHFSNLPVGMACHKTANFPDQFAMVIPDAWSAGNASGLSSSHKPQSGDADPHAGRECGAQGRKAGHQRGTGSEYIVYQENVPDGRI